MVYFSRKWQILQGLFLVSLSILLISVQALATSCPSVKKMEKAVKKTFRQNIQVLTVSPSVVPGLCQVEVKFRGQKRIIYSDPKGKYLIAGQIFSTADGTNLTRKAIVEINRLTKKELKELDSLVAFTIGTRGPVIYFVTDPHCPYCKKAEKILEPMAKAGKVTVKFILFPLQFHKGAKEECISIICDKKGFEGFKNRYRSENQCEAGKKQVENTIKFLVKKGISGTPTYIFPDGRYHSGVMDEKALEAKLSKFK